MAAERRLSVKRLVLFVFLPLVLLIGAAVGVMTSGLIKTSDKDEPPPVPKVDLTKLPGGYVEIPDLIINMRAADGSPRLLIMQATIRWVLKSILYGLHNFKQMYAQSGVPKNTKAK